LGNEFFKNSNLGFNDTNAVRNNFDTIKSIRSSVRIGFSFIITPFLSSLMFDFLLSWSFFLFISFRSSVINSFIEGRDFVFKVKELSLSFIKENNLGSSGGIVFSDPCFIFSSFDFSWFSNLFKESIDQSEDFGNCTRICLNGSGCGDLRENFEDLVPWISFERFGVSLEVFRDLNEGLWFEGFLEEWSTETVFNDFLSTFDYICGTIVFILFCEPISILFSLFFIKFGNLIRNLFFKFSFFSVKSFLFISNGGFFIDFSLKFISSVISSLNFSCKSSKIRIAFGSKSSNVIIVFFLFSLDTGFNWF